ncbi:MAG: SNF2 helicase associated domain-containing protein [Calditrichaeota bacterium]|nr:SNF2 helicase associated domain-containing protein [Calditrichota bacterium]
MTWKIKIEQLSSLLEKIPHPQSFDMGKGVYQPYFILEIRPANWEIMPFAEYTRLDGVRGKETRLNYQVIESQKVNISQDELNLLSYLLSFNNYDTRRIFNYGQPVGFLLDWLRGSHVKKRNSVNKEMESVEIVEETGNIALGMFRDNGEYILRPIIVYSDQTIFLDDQVDVLSANPIYLLHGNKLCRVDSRMPAFFWINVFRLQQNIRIPGEEIKEFISSFISKIVPALDWKSLEEHLKIYELPLKSTRIYLYERAGQFGVDVKFLYKNIEFPAYPASDKSLASHDNYLFIVKRDTEAEISLRRTIHHYGLLYIQHRWQIDPQYSVLDWLRLMVPELTANPMIEIVGENSLSRHRLKRGQPNLHVKIKSKNGWFNFAYELRLDDAILDIDNVKDILAINKKYVKVDDGINVYFGEKFSGRLLKFLTTIGQASSRGSDNFNFASFPLVDMLVKLADTVDVDNEYQKWENDYTKFNRIESIDISKLFKGKLRDYQKTGLDWLNFLNKFYVGGILADDMGLGKTIQVIALMVHLKGKNDLSPPTLIVVPLTVLHNWDREIRRFAPSIKSLIYHGSKAGREEMASNFAEYDVILLSYGILLQDQQILQENEWNYIILDESQKIKNSSTKTYKAIGKLRSHHRLCLTGTPVENSIADLWSQFNFLNPGMLGNLDQFENRFGKNGNNKSENEDLLRRIIHPFILRRKKEDVLSELPERTDIVQFIDMTENQQKIYHKWLIFYRSHIFEQIQTNGLSRSRFKVLEALTYLRQLSCHPAIFDPNIDLRDSGKFQLLEEMMEELIQEGHKILIFSQFVRFLTLARDLMDNREWRYEYLDGSTRNRDKVIANFQKNSEIKIFLISLKAGGLGLNLTAADYVIHLDPWWNPAVEQQATDRAHRIGQKNRVFVYKYILRNSVEEKILELQESKKKLSKNLIKSEDGFLKQLSAEDLRLIFEH